MPWRVAPDGTTTPWQLADEIAAQRANALALRTQCRRLRADLERIRAETLRVRYVSTLQRRRAALGRLRH